MAEGKKVEYKRETVGKAALDLLDRIRAVNAEEQEYYHVSDLIIYGSFVNTDKPKIHDLDVIIEIVKTPFYFQKVEETGLYSEKTIKAVRAAPPRAPFPQFELYCYRNLYPDKVTSVVLQYSFLYEQTMRRLKNRSNIISFHPITELMYGDIPEKELLIIMSDGVIADDAEQRIKELSNITKGK